MKKTHILIVLSLLLTTQMGLAQRKADTQVMTEDLEALHSSITTLKLRKLIGDIFENEELPALQKELKQLFNKENKGLDLIPYRHFKRLYTADKLGNIALKKKSKVNPNQYVNRDISELSEINKIKHFQQLLSFSISKLKFIVDEQKKYPMVIQLIETLESNNYEYNALQIFAILVYSTDIHLSLHS